MLNGINTSDLSVIGISDIDGKGAHAVVPYKIVDEENGISKIFVYDPNDPCKPGSPCTAYVNKTDPYDRYIKIDFSSNPVSWEYKFDPSDYNYFNIYAPGVWFNPLAYTIPLSFIKDNQYFTLPYIKANSKYIYSTGNSDLFIKDQQGNGIGFQNDTQINNISGGYINIPPIGSSKVNPSFTIPSNFYTIYVQGKQTANENIDIFGTNTLLQIANLPISTGSADTITADQNNRTITISTQDSRKNYKVNLYTQPVSDYTKEFNVTGLTIASGETDTLTLTDDNQSLQYVNSGQSEDIRITIKQVGQNNGEIQFEQPLTVNSNDTLIIKPTDWNNLDTSATLIQVNPATSSASQYYLNLTSASLSPSPNEDGTYTDPVTVTLTAGQSAGINIANTFYTIDNNPQQSYTSTPFTVTGNGDHALTYWSVDDAGITESVNSKTFTIHSSEPTPQPVTKTFNSSADTYIRDGADNRNAGAGTFMRLQESGNNRSLIRFDQSEIQSQIGNKQVLSAKLRVTIVDNGNNWGTTGRSIDIHRLIADWTEGNGTENSRGTGSGATWECAIDSLIENQAKNCSGTTEWEIGQPNNPSVHPWIQTASDTQTITNNQSGVVEFDVTSDVTSFLNSTNQNYGWIIKKTNEGQNGKVSFGTKESASVPQLVVIYQS